LVEFPQNFTPQYRTTVDFCHFKKILLATVLTVKEMSCPVTRVPVFVAKEICCSVNQTRMIVRPAGTVMSGSPQLVQSQQQQQQQQIQQQQLQQQQLTRVPVSSNIIRTGKRILPVPVPDQQYTCFNSVSLCNIILHIGTKD
jgi:hypothetical protein